MNASKKNKKKKIQIEYPEFKVLTTVSESSLALHVKKNICKST